MTVMTTYFCDHCERVIEDDKVTIQVTLHVPGSPIAGAPDLVSDSRYESKSIHFHPACAKSIIGAIRDGVVTDVEIPQ